MKSQVLVLLIVLLTINQVVAQQTLVDCSGVAVFSSEALVQDIEAINKEVLGALEVDRGTMTVSMLIKGFRFDNSLMEEHFNASFLESEKYPQAIFRGCINDFSTLDFSNLGVYEMEVEGEMEIHGVKRPLKTMVELDVLPTMIKASTSFEVSIADHNIKTPVLVEKKLGEVVEVKASFNFSK